MTAKTQDLSLSLIWLPRVGPGFRPGPPGYIGRKIFLTENQNIVFLSLLCLAAQSKLWPLEQDSAATEGDRERDIWNPKISELCFPKLTKMPTLTKLFTMQEASQHNTKDDCWVVIDGKVPFFIHGLSYSYKNIFLWSGLLYILALVSLSLWVLCCALESKYIIQFLFWLSFVVCFKISFWVCEFLLSGSVLSTVLLYHMHWDFLTRIS